MNRRELASSVSHIALNAVLPAVDPGVMDMSQFGLRMWSGYDALSLGSASGLYVSPSSGAQTNQMSDDA